MKEPPRTFFPLAKPSQKEPFFQAIFDLDSSQIAFGRVALLGDAAFVAHGRELGAFLQGSDTPEARRHHTPEAVLREIADTREYV